MIAGSPVATLISAFEATETEVKGAKKKRKADEEGIGAEGEKKPKKVNPVKIRAIVDPAVVADPAVAGAVAMSIDDSTSTVAREDIGIKPVDVATLSSSTLVPITNHATSLLEAAADAMALMPPPAPILINAPRAPIAKPANSTDKRMGKWASWEEDLLRKNVEKFKADHNIEKLEEFILASRVERKTQTVDESKLFYPTISEGLDRPMLNVYKKVHRLYDPNNYSGVFKPDETEQVKALHALHGPAWKTIGLIVQRSPQSVRDHFRQCVRVPSQHQKGRWQDHEVALLHKLVKESQGLTELDRRNIDHGVHWENISKAHGSRTPFQCRHKWVSLNYFLNVKESDSKWSPKDDQILLESVSSCGADDVCRIPWLSLSQEFKGTRVSHHDLQAKWLRLCNRITNHKSMPLEEVLEKLMAAQTLKDTKMALA